MKAFDSEQKRITGVGYVFNLLRLDTPFGRDLLKNAAPVGRDKAKELGLELENVGRALAAMKDGDTAFTNLRRILAKFKDIRGSVAKLRQGVEWVLGEVDLFEIKTFLLALSELSALFADMNGRLGFSGIEIITADGALALLDPEGTRLPSFHISELYSEKLMDIRRRKRELEKRLTGCADAERAELARFREGLAAEEADEERVVRGMLTEGLRPYRDIMETSIAGIGRLDFIAARARLALEYSCVKPEIVQDTVMLAGMWSPEVDEVLKKGGKRMTAVSIELEPGACVLTGPNMGGKSVALRTLVMNAYLFQCGFFVFAQSAALPVFDNIEFIFEDSQSVQAGLSSFGAEIVAINGILKRARDGFSLIALDEPAKGTNPQEGREIAAALTECLNGMDAVSIIATHYDHVAALGRSNYAIAGLKTAEVSRAGKLTPGMISEFMDYRLVKFTETEQTAPRDALTICKLMGLDSAVMDLLIKDYPDY